jgi:N6-adenosine-specific RNA methylase IME4
LIVVDPPWSNRSVQRGKKYTTLTNQQLLRLDVPVLADPAGCVLALWVTNDPAVISFALETLLPRWGFELVEEWLWLKIAADGELISSVTSRHKKPYERLLLARFNHGGIRARYAADDNENDGEEDQPQERATKRRRSRTEAHGSVETCSTANEPRIPTNVFICPSLRHSMKPPIEAFLVEWAEQQLSMPINAAHGEGAEGDDAASLRTTELFARETKEGFISVGNQPLLFQIKDWFLASEAPPPPLGAA